MAEAVLPDQPLIAGHKTPAQISAEISAPLGQRPNRTWWLLLAISGSALGLGLLAIGYELFTGIGTWGLNRTVGWGFDITNFVFWVGIGHAGTLISAVLFIFRQSWRTSLNRAAEAMTLFAVMCAGIFPLIHMGRPWLAYWMFPYPNVRGSLWINFRSPLVWDFFAISTYFTISAVFWFVGLIPDLATLRDRTAPGLRQRIYSFLSLGWDGSYRTWHRYEAVYLLLAGLATPLVVSVHTIVSTDFATAVLPGWHTTILPPYFVCGAIFSGMSMVLALMLVTRGALGLRDYIQQRHIDAMSWFILGTSGVVLLAYVTELFTAFYTGNPYEAFVFKNRALGPLGWSYWIMVCCNGLVPQLLWFRGVRHRPAAVFAVTIAVNIGMWFERFVIIVTSLHRDFLPSSWASYQPTLIEGLTMLGTFGLFFTAFLIFCRLVPVIAIAEVKQAVVAEQGGAAGGH
ncbi:MAG: polysulfide reductase NrfD [Fimbriimonadaceae bacterium]|nr:polysulfide reductase NrfD [Fimbriimonadaceae bacterium]